MSLNLRNPPESGIVLEEPKGKIGNSGQAGKNINLIGDYTVLSFN